MYLVLSLHKCEDMKVNVFGDIQKISFSDWSGLIGFCPVYETRELAMSEHPGYEVIEIEKNKI